MKRIKILFFSLLVLNIGCTDEENNNVPLVEVNFSIQINEPEYNNLKSVGGWVYVVGGSRGIILYRLSNEKISAYDRHCTFQPSEACALVSVDVTNLTASDACCGSKFLLQNGSVSRPPAAFPLKQYNTYFDGTVLTVTN